jgi:hypothetical protein
MINYYLFTNLYIFSLCAGKFMVPDDFDAALPKREYRNRKNVRY